MRILLVEDDEVISKNIKTFLAKRGMSVDLSTSIEEGYQKISDEEYDLIVLDRGLPDGDGIDLVKKIRDEDLSTPVLMLTAKSEDCHVIEGLNIGADDYLSKPFDMEILSARIKAVIRRGKKIISKPVINIDDLQIDTNSAEVKLNDKYISLSPREYSILEYLAINRGNIVDRMTLLSHAWDENIDMFSNTVDVHIKYLRNKLGDTVIKTVRGKGYIIPK